MADGRGKFRLRAFTYEDLPQAVELWAGAFGVELPDEDARLKATQRLAFSLDSDPAGSFAAEIEGRLVGLSQALVKERLWVLSSLAVDRGAQDRGVGRALLERAFAYGGEGLGRLVVSSDDPRAIALYGAMGLEVRRTVQAAGTPRGAGLGGAAGRFREGGRRDLAGLEELSREIRGAPHTRELEFALERGDARLLLGEEAFAVVRPGHGVWLLLAREEQQAQALLGASLGLAGECERSCVRWVTHDQHWALEVFEREGLAVAGYGALCVGGAPGPLRPFIPSGPFA